MVGWCKSVQCTRVHRTITQSQNRVMGLGNVLPNLCVIIAAIVHDVMT